MTAPRVKTPERFLVGSSVGGCVWGIAQAVAGTFAARAAASPGTRPSNARRQGPDGARADGSRGADRRRGRSNHRLDPRSRQASLLPGAPSAPAPGRGLDVEAVMDCRDFRSRLRRGDVTGLPAEGRRHVESCPGCREDVRAGRLLSLGSGPAGERPRAGPPYHRGDEAATTGAAELARVSSVGTSRRSS